jgi:hypothetical protein
VIDFEPGQAKTIDLVKLTNYPYPDAVDELDFRVLPPAPEGFDLSVDGQELTVEAAESTATGARQAVTIAVADAAGDGRPGRIDLRVVPSTRPLAQPAADVAVAARGRTTTIDVLANDRATNPFPGTPLRVVGVRGLDDSLPDGVSIEPSDDRSTLTVDVGPGAAPVNTTLQYQVADATDDPSRYAWGTVTISVQDRPDPVTGAQVTGFGDGTLDVAFGAGGFNNSPITGYEIALVDPAGSTVLTTSTCAATDLHGADAGQRPGQRGAGPRAGRNAIGLSDPVEAPGPIWSDVIPPPPQALRALPLDGRLRLEWAPVGTGAGSQVESYVSQWRASRWRWTPRRMHGLAVRHRVPGHREREPGAVHGERAEPGVPGPRHMDRGRRQRHAVRCADRGRHRRHGRRRGRHGHGVVGAVRRQRRCHRRLLRAAAGRRPDCGPSGPQACSVTSPAPATCGPGERRQRRRGRPGRAGCLERAVHRHGDRVDAGTPSSSGATTGPAARTRRSRASWSGPHRVR